MTLSRRALFLVCALLISPVAAFAGGFRFTRSTGPFMIPADAQAVDWVAVNNTSASQDIRVSVYRLSLTGPKVLLVPGALTVTLGPGETTHNANSVGTVFQLGVPHEIVIESDSLDVLPMAISWSTHSAANPIPASTIPAGDWVELRR